MTTLQIYNIKDKAQISKNPRNENHRALKWQKAQSCSSVVSVISFYNTFSEENCSSIMHFRW